MVLIKNNISVCQVLGRPILALEVNSEIFYQALKPLLDANLGKTIVQPIFNLDDNSPIKKRSRINFDYE
jgi:hypothetical protein